MHEEALVNVIVIPTAAGLDDYGEQFQHSYFRPFRERGVANIQVLHAMDREIADSDAFVAPLRTATGVWFSGSRQWRLADAYLDTKTERALWSLLDRGGVIGGGSAGTTSRARILCAAIRIDAYAGIVVHGDEFRVIGAGYVAIYDPKLIAANGHFYFLEKGERFQLSTRTAMSEKGEPLWLPQILPTAKLTRKQLHEIAGTYLAGEQHIPVILVGERILATLCAGDERELIPISADVLYDKIDSSKITLHRARSGAVSGLTWKVERYVGQRLCREGIVKAVKERG